MAGVARAVAAVRAGKPIVLPTDTVYGLCAAAFDDAAVGRLYALKGRAPSQPTAVLFAGIETLLERLGVEGRAARVVEALLPGPYTLVLPNPGRALLWLAGDRPETIGVRVPALSGAAASVLESEEALAATSANAPGGSEPRRLLDVPEDIRAACGAVVDGGDLPGTPSTIVDVTGPEPRVLREGPVSAAAALDRIRDAE